MRGYHDLTEEGRARRLRGVVTAALEHYDLEAARLRLITNETNGVFRMDVAGGGKYVVRVGLGGDIGHSPGQVEAETSWLAALAEETDIPVPVPVPARDGRRWVTAGAEGVPDRRNVVVFTWLPGVLLEERLGEETVRALGALAARLHEHGRVHRPADPGAVARYDRLNPFEEPMVVFEDGAGLLPPAGRIVFEAARERVESALQELRAGGGPMRLLHGDLHPWNVMAGRTGLAPFDFEDLMLGWPVQDVATSIWYLYRRPEAAAWLPRFREGYESVSEWPEGRAGEITTFLMGRALVLANAVMISPEWRSEAPRVLGAFEDRLVRLMEEDPLSR